MLHRMFTPSPDGRLRLQILGPLRVWRGSTEIATGPPQQAQLLALLLARAGRPISTTELVHLIWDEAAPSSARNILHKYVGALRRLLQPEIRPRAGGSYLLRRGDAYLITVGPEVADVVAFRELVAAARTSLGEHRPAEAFAHYATALDLWQGPAGDGLGSGPSAMATFTGLDREFFDACVEAAVLGLTQDRPKRLLTALRLAASSAPLNEELQAALIRVLAAAGRQAEALAVFASVRDRLVEELGLDPGAGLMAAHQWVLTQSPPASPIGTVAVPRPGTSPSAGPSPSPVRVTASLPASSSDLVGRSGELGLLRHAAGSTLAGNTALVVIEGEPGSGKTRLLEEMAAEARAHGAQVLWGSGCEVVAAPTMWPWRQALGGYADVVSEDVGEDLLFRLYEQIVAHLKQVSAEQPVLLILDDLQWADATSLKAFAHVAARLPDGVMLAGALRDRAPVPSAELTRTLAWVSRQNGHVRIRLHPLDPGEVGELVHRETGRHPRPDTVRQIHARTAGNPFLTLELIRSPTTAVPSSVRDVVQARTEALDEPSRHLLETAALLESPMGVRLLAHAADLTVPTCLDRLEPLLAAGFLTLNGPDAHDIPAEPGPEEPFRVWFEPDLVRESVATTVSPGRAGRIRQRAADARDHLV